MTELLQLAVDRIRALSPEIQDEAARLLLRLAGEVEAVYQLTPEEEADIIAGENEAARGEFATEAEVDAVLSPIHA